MWKVTVLALAAALIASGENYALIMGIGAYKKTTFQTAAGAKPTSLPGIDLDVKMMVGVAAQMGYKPAEIHVLFNEQASLAGMRAAFREIAVKAGPRDHVLIYYSGHGSRVPDDDGDNDEPDGYDEVLVPWDFDQDPKTLGLRRETVLVDDEIAVLLAKIRSENTLMIIDACNSGSVDRSFDFDSKGLGLGPEVAVKRLPNDVPPAIHAVSTSDKAAGAMAGPSDRYIALMAARDTEFANATSQGSLLTQAVAKGVAEATRGHSPVTAERLLQLANATVSEFAMQLPAGQISQHPQLAGNLNKKGINLRSIDDQFAMVSEWAASIPGKLTVSLDKASVGPNDVITLTVRDLPRAGYLNLVEVGSVTQQVKVLFPNKYFHGSNRVEQGKTLVLPSPDHQFEFYARPPEGATSEKVIFVAILTEEPRDLNAASDDVNASFRRLAPANERDFEVRARAGNSVYAGTAIVEVRAK
jgi:hypothetical protein